MPQDMEGGKDKIVFGNIQQIYEWHKSTFSPELENCLNEESGYIGQLFVKYVSSIAPFINIDFSETIPPKKIQNFKPQ